MLDRQRLPEEPIEIELDDVTLWLDTEVAGLARDAARASRLVHNQARAVFDHQVIEALTLRDHGSRICSGIRSSTAAKELSA